MSNKTQKAGDAKTKSALSARLWVVLASFFMLFAGLGLFAALLIDKADLQEPIAEYHIKSECLQMKDTCFVVERADTNEARMKGLSGRESLLQNHAMLFVFDTPDKHCFWMKEMKFAIDMIWLNENREIIKIEQNVTPETYPASFCAENTKYVLEINAGLSNGLGINLGDRIDI